ncbi:plasmid and phage replicative helicase [Novosphingobium aromaticivorans DSM 12444]|uniref:Plasmid and phage replicative helicase n=1 Tax=Novosphingobium aromaticivorans (strain ATCC 700278 / DSM 12444 / CCUG 56034 / CIP 105152 / NBRC 16084 / F199) TaxID=279238 RepID=Q2G4S5_NOVAD|nr:AAA family ATPase [Novosphingobium aromaticivorans]ABD27148.1 plasmid and phage replicative helicase [Novosphingobium aromaticivorans DSM 12444]SCY89474.1 plasmid and phage replicative helicase [Novosphingobium aromaticivorans]
MSVSDAGNFDANDVAVTFGIDKVREAFEQRRSTLPPFAPYDEEPESERPKLKATPFSWRDPATIPPRKWLYGRHLIRKFLSLDIAPGGLGKSSVKIVEALAMTTGRNLLGKDCHEGPLNVWLYNLEDPAEETERRIHAAAQWFEIGPDDVGERLFVDSGREQPICIAEETDGGARIVRPVVEAVIEQLKDRRIDVLSIDPFVSSHAISENDNRAIDMVAKEWSRIADICDCAINLVHHVRKTNGAEVTAESSRGAVSLIGAARSVVVYNRMTKEEGERAGIEPRQLGFYFRTQNDKANLAPPEAADWFRMNNVDLPNGDSVGVACPWQWPDPFDGVSTWHLKEVQKRVSQGRYRADVRSAQWVGHVIANVLDIDLEKKAGRVKDILKQWLKNDMLREVEGTDEKRNVRKFVEVGTWHTD